MFFRFVFFFASVLLYVVPILAQVLSVIGEYEDWSAYSFRDGENNLICYMLSEPIQQEFYECPAGEVPGTHCPQVEAHQVKREFTYAIIRHMPYRLSLDVPSFDIGYTFKEGSFSKVSVVVGTDTFEFSLITQNNNSWTFSNEDDKRLTEKIRDGRTMKVEGISSRGTYTVDTYSLRGSRDALKAIDESCQVERTDSENETPPPE